jgi:hypothetical protein
MLGGISAAQANDALRAKVIDADGGIVTENGAFLTPGTYAIGTLKVHYFVTGRQFQADMPRTITVCFDTVAATAKGASKQATNYPATVTLEQVGGAHVVLAPSQSPLEFGYTGDEHCIELTATVPATVANDPAYQDDGEELVANLQLRTPSGTNLDTVTTIKVHLTLVHPTACLRPLHTVMNQDLSTDLTLAGISLSFQQNQAKLSSNPVFPHHVLALVNTCDEAVTVDVQTGIDENFAVFHSSAVRTTTLNQEVDDTAALLSTGLIWDSFSTVNGATMCLQNVNVPANQTVVIGQRISILESGKFPGGPGARELGSSSYDGFGFSAHQAGGACQLGLSDEVLPNRGVASVPVTAVQYTGNVGSAGQGGTRK